MPYILKGGSAGLPRTRRTLVRETADYAVYVKHDSRTQVVAKKGIARRLLTRNKKVRVWMRTTTKRLKVVPIGPDNHCYPHEASMIEDIITVVAKDLRRAATQLGIPLTTALSSI